MLNIITETLIPALFVLAVIGCGIEDARTHIVPSVLTTSIALLAILRMVLTARWALAFGAIPAVFFFLFFTLSSGKHMLGGGDIKLMFGIGIYFGLMNMLYILIGACITALIAGALRVASNKNKGSDEQLADDVPAPKDGESCLDAVYENIEAENPGEKPKPSWKDVNVPFCTWIALISTIWLILTKIPSA